MISFKTYLTELFDTEPNFVEKHDQGAYRHYTALIAGKLYNYSVLIKNNAIIFDFMLDRSNTFEMTNLNVPFKVFAIQGWLIKELSNEFPTKTLTFEGDLDRDKLYHKFAQKIANELNGRLQVIKTNSGDIQYYSYHIIRD